jgi:type IV pilus assembly protein PilO
MKVDLKNPAFQKAALSIVLVLAVVWGFFFTHFVPFGFLPSRERIEVLKADYEKKSTELARARATVADLPRFEAEYAQLHERWAAAAELLPPDREVAGLLRRITLAGQQTGVEFLMFRPAGVNSQEHYVEIPLELQIFGEYHQIGSFLAELANMRRIVTVSKLKLKENDNSDKWASTMAEFTASAYSLNATSATPKPQPATPARAIEPAIQGGKKDDQAS